jgi:hypothetical protein
MLLNCEAYMQHHSKYVPISHALIHVASRQPPLYENPNH